MDQRIEAFLADVLALAGEEPDAVREGVRVALADCEAIFRAQETHKRMKTSGGWPVASRFELRHYPNSAMPERRFPLPWTVERSDARFLVRDHGGQALAYVCRQEKAPWSVL